MKTGLLISFILISLQVFAAEKPASPAVDKATQQKHDFEDLLVQGKYHFSDDAVTTVEEDKVLDSLIGVRSDFKDKIQNSDAQF